MELQSPSGTKDPLEQYYDYDDSELLKLEIKPSGLPFSGQGLFAKEEISSLEIIAEYYGSIMWSKNSMDNEFAHEDKMVQIDNKYSVISRGPASRANDTVRWQPQNYNTDLFRMLRKKQTLPTHPNYHHNAKISIEPNQKAFLRATRPIQAGQEIYIDYGFDYWDFFYREHLKQSQ